MILLTGATGYLGSQIARELLNRHVPLRVLVRNPSRLDFDPAKSGCEVVIGDLCDPVTVRAAVGGVRHVIHSAALVKMWVRDRRSFWRVNVDGLKNLCRAAADAGVERIVYTSSFIALGPSSDPSAGESLQNHGPYSNEYEQTKAEALDWLRAEGFRQFPVVALLPGVIYGPGPFTGGNLVGDMVYRYLFTRLPVVLGSGDQRWSFAFNADVVAAHLSALEKGDTGKEYILGGDNRSLNEMYGLLPGLSGIHRHVRHVPFSIGAMMGAIELMRARFFAHEPLLTPGVVEIFKHDWVYSSARAASELSYRITRLEEGLAKTLTGALDCAKGETSSL